MAFYPGMNLFCVPFTGDSFKTIDRSLLCFLLVDLPVVGWIYIACQLDTFSLRKLSACFNPTTG